MTCQWVCCVLVAPWLYRTFNLYELLLSTIWLIQCVYWLYLIILKMNLYFDGVWCGWCSIKIIKRLFRIFCFAKQKQNVHTKAIIFILLLFITLLVLNHVSFWIGAFIKGISWTVFVMNHIICEKRTALNNNKNKNNQRRLTGGTKEIIISEICSLSVHSNADLCMFWRK